METPSAATAQVAQNIEFVGFSNRLIDTVVDFLPTAKAGGFLSRVRLSHVIRIFLHV